jgi:hypothetical protein
MASTLKRWQIVVIVSASIACWIGYAVYAFWPTIKAQSPEAIKVAQMQRAEELQAANAARTALLRSDIVRKLTCDNQEAQVPIGSWAQLPVDQKRSLVMMLARICKAETGYANITLIEAMSGRRLAQYNGFSGIEF